MIPVRLRGKPRRRKVSFFGNFGQGNFGNEATLRAILLRLRKALPDAEMSCICTGPTVTMTTHNITAIAIHDTFLKPDLLQGNFVARFLRKIFIGIPIEAYRWIRAVLVLAKTDILIVPGTQFLSDNLTGPWGWPYMAFKWSIAAKMRKCKLAFVSVGVGPLRHPLSRFFAKFALSLADFRSYRDLSSREYVRSIGFKHPNDPIYPDLAFSLEAPAHAECPGSRVGRPIIAVGVKDFHGQYRQSDRHLSADDSYRLYLQSMTAFVVWLLDHGYAVRLVIGDATYDRQVVDDLKNAIKDGDKSDFASHLIVEPIESLKELISQLAGSDIVVSPRFHNIVFALLLNKPVLALSYHEKFAVLLESSGLSRFNVPIEDADLATLIERFHELETEVEDLKRKIGEDVNRYRAALEQQYGCILSLLSA